MTIRNIAIMALSTAFIAPAWAQTEPATPPDPTTAPGVADPAAPPPTLPGEPAAPVTPAPKAPATAADVDKALTDTFGASEPYKQFFEVLQKEVGDGDKKAVAKLVAYPFKTKVDGADVTYEKEADLVKAYDDVFTSKVVDAVKAQTYENLVVNDLGVSIGSGNVWFKAASATEPVKIIAVNQGAGA